MRAAMFVSEFGNDPGDDSLILQNQLQEQERHRVGFAFWTWNENGNQHSWGVFPSRSACMRPSREAMLARVYPRLTADPEASFHYDPADGRFTMLAYGRAADPTTVVYVPREVGGQVTREGAARLVVSENEGDG